MPDLLPEQSVRRAALDAAVTFAANWNRLPHRDCTLITEVSTIKIATKFAAYIESGTIPDKDSPYWVDPED